MIRRRIVELLLVVCISVSIGVATAQAQRKAITTLLPSEAASQPARSDDMLRISADGSDPPKSTSHASLLFAFASGAIPPEATIAQTTLRLVGKPIGRDNPQIVRLVLNAPEPVSKDAIGMWTAIPGETIFSTTSDGLLEQVRKAHSNQGQLSFNLISTSRLGNWEYYALSTNAYPSSRKPRLIIEYERPEAAADQQAANTPTRTTWRFFGTPTEVTASRLLNSVTIISNPVFYQGGVYLFGKPTPEETYLYALSPGGGERWRTRIHITPGPHARVSNTGRLYSAGENRIVVYDLDKKGAESRNVSLPDVTIAVPPTLGADGSLYFVRSGYGYVYGLSLDQQELWRYPEKDDTGPEKVSQITLSPEPQRYAYLLTRRDNKNALVRIDATDGSAEPFAIGDKYTDFHRPVVVKGPEQDYVFVSAYSQSDGTLLAYSGGSVLWENQGPVSQPIVDREGKKVFVIQGGQLRVYDIFNGKAVCASAEGTLAATSNLVLDGEENLYFWNNGTLYGYRKDCQALVTLSLAKAGLPRDLELLFAPDGTLYARTATQQLFSLTPSRPALTLAQSEVRTDTIYTGDTIQVATNLQVSKDMHLTLKADKTIAFGPGFSVQRGARLRCQIGF